MKNREIHKRRYLRIYIYIVKNNKLRIIYAEKFKDKINIRRIFKLILLVLQFL